MNDLPQAVDESLSPAGKIAGPLRLLIGCLTIVAVWGYALPRLAKTELVADHLEFLEAREIDPSAMFYTELDIMDAILKKHDVR